MRTLNVMLRNTLVALTVVCAGCGSDTATPTSTTSTPSDTTASTTDPGTTATPSTTGSGTARGTVQDQTLTPKSAASAQFTDEYGIYYLAIVLSNQADYCGITALGQKRPNHRSLTAALAAISAQGKSLQVSPGTYTVTTTTPSGAASIANASFYASDSNCQSLFADDAGTATSGTVKITEVTSTGATGSYQLTFGSDTLTGTFSAPACAALKDQAENGTTLTCTP